MVNFTGWDSAQSSGGANAVRELLEANMLDSVDAKKVEDQPQWEVGTGPICVDFHVVGQFVRCTRSRNRARCCVRTL